VKFSANVVSGGLKKRLVRLLSELEPAVLDAAAESLSEELRQARDRDNLRAPLVRSVSARQRTVGAGDPESIAREFGSPTEPPAPWLAPALPAALARMRREATAHAGNIKNPMRAAVFKAVARALSRTR
jgi:hypothetical protein